MEIDAVVQKMQASLAEFESDKKLRNINPFLSTYLIVTQEVLNTYKRSSSSFEDFNELQRLDVCFADLFFDAVERLKAGSSNLHPWKTFFDYCLGGGKVPFVKMLLGINAHINGDLAFALENAQVRSRADFLFINVVLKRVIPDVLKTLAFHYHDPFATGGLLFQGFMTNQFEAVVAKWRENAWRAYSDKSFSSVHLQTEQTGEQIIRSFSFPGFFSLPGNLKSV